MGESVAYSDVPEGFQVKSSPVSPPSYSDVPDGFSVKNTDNSYTPDAVRGAYQSTMNSAPVRGINAAMDTATKAVGSKVNSLVPQRIKDKFSAAGDYFANKDKITSPIYTAAKEGITELGEQVQDLSSYDQGGKGNLAHDLPALGQNAKLLGNMAITKPLSEAAVNAVAHPIATTGKVVNSALKVSGAALKPVVKPMVRGILDSDNPIIGGNLKSDLSSKEAEKTRALGERVGVNFSAAEQTGNTMARGIEDTLANSPKWSGKFAEENEKKTDAVVKKFKEVLNTIAPKATSVAALGESLTKAYKDSIASLVNARSAQGEVDFGTARQATGGQPVIVPNNVIQVYNKFIEEGASPTATKEQESTGKAAKKALAKLTEKPAPASKILDAYGNPIERSPTARYKKITVNDLQNGLKGSGEAAKSPGSITGGLKTAADRRFDKELKNAYEADLDSAADSGAGEGATALKVARDNWRKMSAKIGDIQQTALGKVVGGAQRNSEGKLIIFPEKMADKFLSMEPSEIKATLKFLDQEHPDVANMARRHTLEAAYKMASEGVGQSSAGAIKEFDMKKFVENLPHDDKLEAILGSHKAVGEVHDISEAMNRLRWYGGRRGGSQTFGRTEILNGFKGWGAKKLYQSALDDTLAEDMLNPQKRAEFAAEANKINGKASANQALGAETNPLAAGANP